MSPESKAIYLQRINTCKACPDLLKVIQTCKKCGCIVPAKALLPNATCPAGKWPQAPEAP
jgi:hypothetical protein